MFSLERPSHGVTVGAEDDVEGNYNGGSDQLVAVLLTLTWAWLWQP